MDGAPTERLPDHYEEMTGRLCGGRFAPLPCINSLPVQRARPRRRLEYAGVRRISAPTDANEILVEEAKVYRNHAGPGEYAFVEGLNRRMGGVYRFVA
jgi:hypothetical protein